MSPNQFQGYGYQRTPGSHSPHSQLISGIAATIQFQPGTIGWTHLGFPFQATLAGHPKHTAIPKPPVRVGVAKTLTKLVAAFVQSDHPAHGPPQKGPGIKVAEVAGYTDGRQHGDLPQLV
jgi:hypothetical protein